MARMAFQLSTEKISHLVDNQQKVTSILYNIMTFFLPIYNIICQMNISVDKHLSVTIHSKGSTEIKRYSVLCIYRKLLRNLKI
jgi:hypothetical protein